MPVSMGMPSDGELKKYAELAEIPLFILGFSYGATEDLAKGGSYSSLNFQTAVQQRVVDAIARATGFQLKLGSITTSQTQKFNMTGWLNKGLIALGWAYVYKEADGPYKNTIWSIVAPFASGYVVGGLFDPPAVTVYANPAMSSSASQMSSSASLVEQTNRQLGLVA